MKKDKIHTRLIIIRVLATLSLLLGGVMVYYRDSAGWEPLSGFVVGACVMSASATAWLATLDETVTGFGVFLAFFPMAAIVVATLDAWFIGAISVIASSALGGYVAYRLMREPLIGIEAHE
jgi:uncharacterized membrane protein (UPF0136 family)